MCFIDHEFSDILKCFDKHECSRMYHCNLAMLSGQLETPLDEGGVEVRVEFVRLLIVVLNKLLKLWTKITTVRIGRICRGHIVLGGE